MGIFYRYKCLKCGERYKILLKKCEVCGAELSMACPIDSCMNAERRPTEYCKEIMELQFFSGNRKRIKELEGAVEELRDALLQATKDVATLKWENHLLGCSLKNATHENNLLHEQVRNFKWNNSKTEIPESNKVIQAVKYAMKYSHPDNGGNTEDFVKFQKLYKELTRK